MALTMQEIERELGLKEQELRQQVERLQGELAAISRAKAALMPRASALPDIVQPPEPAQVPAAPPEPATEPGRPRRKPQRYVSPAEFRDTVQRLDRFRLRDLILALDMSQTNAKRMTRRAIDSGMIRTTGRTVGRWYHFVRPTHPGEAHTAQALLRNNHHDTHATNGSGGAPIPGTGSGKKIGDSEMDRYRRLAEEKGYSFRSNGGHWVGMKAGEMPLTIPCTPGRGQRARANIRQEMKRRGIVV